MEYGELFIMTSFESFLHILQAQMPTPSVYGIWHIAFLLLTVVCTVLLVWKFRDASDKTLRRLLLAVWIVMVALEVYKQLVFSMDVTDGVATWQYQWYTFPFQFCSTPLYALPFIVWLPDGWLRKAFMAFFSTFSLFAGIAVMLYPADVFISMIGINVQTMIHHGGQVAIGILLVAYNRHRLNKRYFAESLLLFYVFAAIAMAMNLGVHAALVAARMEDTVFNMFFISPYHDCTLPVLSAIYPKVPYPVFLLIYLVGFAVISALIYAIEKGIVALTSKRGRGKQAKS